MSRAIDIYFLGGTISMSGTEHGAVSRLGARDLLASVPGLDEAGVELIAHDVSRLPSTSLHARDVLDLLGRADADHGAVVVQGTDSMDETAFLADLLWPHQPPIVFTGAMRNPSLAGADGAANLLAAVVTAAADGASGQGAFVVFNDEVHAARFVHKSHTVSTATFVSVDAGPVGRVAETRLRMGLRVPPRDPLPIPAALDSRVPVVPTVFDDCGVLLDGLEERCDGVVIAGHGSGHVPDWLADRIGEIATRVPVVLSTHTGAGPMLTHTYGAVGAELDLIARGAVPSGRLDPYKARLLLQVLLADGLDVAEGFEAHAG